MPRSKNISGVYRPKKKKKTHFPLVSLSVYYSGSHRGAERIQQGERRRSRPSKTALKQSCLAENSGSENRSRQAKIIPVLLEFKFRVSQTSSITNAREHATAKFKTLQQEQPTTVWNNDKLVNHAGVAGGEDTTKTFGIPHRHAMLLQLLACLARHPSEFTSRCGTHTAGRGAFETPPEAALERRYLTDYSNSANRILRPRHKSTPDRMSENNKDPMHFYVQ